MRICCIMASRCDGYDKKSASHSRSILDTTLTVLINLYHHVIKVMYTQFLISTM